MHLSSHLFNLHFPYKKEGRVHNNTTILTVCNSCQILVIVDVIVPYELVNFINLPHNIKSHHVYALGVHRCFLIDQTDLVSKIKNIHSIFL